MNGAFVQHVITPIAAHRRGLATWVKLLALLMLIDALVTFVALMIFAQVVDLIVFAVIAVMTIVILD